MAKRGKFDSEKDSYWRGKIGEQAESGLTISGFCRREGLSAKSFYRWRRVLSERDRSPESRTPTPSVPGPEGLFATVSVVPAGGSPGRTPSLGGADCFIDVVLPSDHVLRVRPEFDSHTLVRLLDLFGASRC